MARSRLTTAPDSHHSCIACGPGVFSGHSTDVVNSSSLQIKWWLRAGILSDSNAWPAERGDRYTTRLSRLEVSPDCR